MNGVIVYAKKSILGVIMRELRKCKNGGFSDFTVIKGVESYNNHVSDEEREYWLNNRSEEGFTEIK